MAELEEMVAYLNDKIDTAKTNHDEEMLREIQDQIYRMIDLEK